MASNVTLFLNGPTLSTATGIFTTADLTTCAPDGWYSDGVISRQLANCKLLSQQACTGCTENTINLQYNASSANDLFCVTSTSVNVFMALGDQFSTTSQIFTDNTLVTPVSDGFYKEKFSNFYREESSSSLGVLLSGPSCPPTNTMFRSELSSVCDSFCSTNYLVSAGFGTIEVTNYFSLAAGDTIVGGLANGFYAYAATSTNTLTGTFKIMEISNNQVLGLKLCDSSGNCVNP